ncbi:hypothetical protein [Hydrogenophaga sp. 5NK40-0174]|uniref:chorismate transformation enzyme, FkbO/Hyg5 family n=1 Tax=Hydrogenophaga sp. 5NK40-0174 TaxID=3127649 RepID=UPI003108531F
MPESMQLHLNVLAQPSADMGVLGAFGVGAQAKGLPSASTLPWQHVRAEVLAQQRAGAVEWWQLDGADVQAMRREPIAGGQGRGAICWSEANGLMFGVAECQEWNPGRAPAGLEAASEMVYEALLGRLSRQSPSLRLWRVWNYIPDIHGEEAGLERYRCFNLGRARAMQRFGQLSEEAIPAACALGVTDGPLSVAFLAGEQRPLPVENPRQVRAYRYPSAYGPQPPSFARASLVTVGEQLWLFVSGTASIVGHESLHPGDVSAQLHESMDNIEVLLREAGSKAESAAFKVDDLHYRVYLRRAADLPQVRKVLADRLGSASWVVCQADVCRKELLVEVEAVGQLPLLVQ